MFRKRSCGAMLSIGLLCLMPFDLRAEDPRAFFNPGIKLGYTFGEAGGMTFGIEFSYTWHVDKIAVGMLLDYDLFGEYSRVHVGIEGSKHVGLSFGPAWITARDETKLGYVVTMFGGAFIYPYYAYTIRPGERGLHEIGAYAKAVIQTKGRGFSFGG